MWLRHCPQLHAVGENYKTEGYVVTPNTMKLLEKHVAAVNGKVVTRFPPEPNGVLHIGHAKAININFGYAKAMGGKCILRYDDTNPEREEEKFFNLIKDMVEWLGFEPWKITHSSDYFDQLYEWAIKLIQKNHAYVCHQNVEDMRGFNPKPSPWRDRPIKESLTLFEQMKNGVFDEGEATLRMKITLEEGKLDPIAYRIKYLSHHRTGDKCIYPTYDYTHCLCDSIENVTHSLCTKEFQTRRSSYYWLCNALDIYCPVQWEYSRLNMEGTVLSKRKILKLIEMGVVSDWDDPRLFTLTALRRRGIPSEAINIFIEKLGLTVAQSTIRPVLLNSVVRDYLNVNAPRIMGVLDPVKVEIINYDQLGCPTSIEVPDFPPELNIESTATHSLTVDGVVYIERTDFEEVGSKGFRRLTTTQSVGLKHIGLVLESVSVDKDSSGRITALKVKAAKVGDPAVKKPKAFIHWVAKPVSCEVRTWERVDKPTSDDDPAAVIPPMNVYTDAVVDASIGSVAAKGCYQFERSGFFGVDVKDSTKDHPVFNLIVPLKDTSKKS